MVDALGSGPSEGNLIGVRVPFRAEDRLLKRSFFVLNGLYKKMRLQLRQTSQELRNTTKLEANRRNF